MRFGEDRICYSVPHHLLSDMEGWTGTGWLFFHFEWGAIAKNYTVFTELYQYRLPTATARATSAVFYQMRLFCYSKGNETNIY